MNAITNSTVDNKFSHWYLFLLSPFIAGLMAVKNYKSGWAKNILWGFIVFYGFTLGISKETSNNADISRYIYELKQMYQKNLSLGQVADLYQNNKDIDIARLTIVITVSRFTDYAPILTAIYGLIFGFFFSRNVWFILDRLKGKIKPLTILFLITFILVNPFWNINGFRFYTAAQVFIYGLLPFLFDGKKKGILISSLSFLVHFSFLLPIMVLFVYIIFGNRTIIYFAFFLASTVVSEIEIGRFNSFVDANTPKALSERTSVYRSDRYVNEYRTGTESFVQNSSWHAKYYMKALNWALTALLILLFFKRKVLLHMSKQLRNSLCFTLLIWGFANVLSSLPSGGRYYTIAYLSLLPLIIFYIHYINVNRFSNRLTTLAIPFLLFFCIVAAREGLYTLTLNTFISNPLVAIFADYSFSINDFIK